MATIAILSQGIKRPEGYPFVTLRSKDAMSAYVSREAGGLSPLLAQMHATAAAHFGTRAEVVVTATVNTVWDAEDRTVQVNAQFLCLDAAAVRELSPPASLRRARGQRMIRLEDE